MTRRSFILLRHHMPPCVTCNKTSPRWILTFHVTCQSSNFVWKDKLGSRNFTASRTPLPKPLHLFTLPASLVFNVELLLQPQALHLDKILRNINKHLSPLPRGSKLPQHNRVCVLHLLHSLSNAIRMQPPLPMPALSNVAVWWSIRTAHALKRSVSVKWPNLISRFQKTMIEHLKVSSLLPFIFTLSYMFWSDVFFSFSLCFYIFRASPGTIETSRNNQTTTHSWSSRSTRSKACGKIASLNLTPQKSIPLTLSVT